MSDSTATVQDIPEVESPNAEAAKYRTRLRDAEAQRDALAAELAGYRNQDLDAQVAQTVELIPPEGTLRAVDPNTGDGVHPETFSPQPTRYALRHAEDLYSVGGVAREDLLDETGKPDQDKVRAALTDLHTQRPDLFDNRGPRNVPTVGKVPEWRPTTTTQWQDVLRGEGKK